MCNLVSSIILTDARPCWLDARVCYTVTGQRRGLCMRLLSAAIVVLIISVITQLLMNQDQLPSPGEYFVCLIKGIGVTHTFAFIFYQQSWQKTRIELRFLLMYPQRTISFASSLTLLPSPSRNNFPCSIFTSPDNNHKFLSVQEVISVVVKQEVKEIVANAKDLKFSSAEVEANGMKTLSLNFFPILMRDAFP